MDGAVDRGLVKVLSVMIIGASILAACPKSSERTYQGYVEGEYVYVASSLAGRLIALSITRGVRVGADAPLFTLEQEHERAEVEEARHRLAQSEAEEANLLKGRRVEELRIIEAQMAEAEAQSKLSEMELKRTQKLLEKNFISREQLDRARTLRDRDRARREELSAQLKTARLAAREDEIAAARAKVASSQAQLVQARWRLQQKSVRAPVEGFVQDTLYRVGEWVPAGNPVISLLPPKNIKIRFFVPETLVARLRAGLALSITCDGCERTYRASISYISSQVEYTPPVIYSRENREKLVYLVEAAPAVGDATELHPGQPVDVTLPNL
jgi:HlyD family secretion protein